MKKIRRQVILAISMVFLVLVVCGATAAAEVSDNGTIQAQNQTELNQNSTNSTQVNTVEINQTNYNSTNSSIVNTNTANQLPKVVISGKVTKCSSGEPFAGATVTAEKDGTKLASTTTKADGTYILEFQNDGGVFNVTASYPGHEPSSKEVTVNPDSNGTLRGTADFQLGMDDVYVSPTGSDITGDGTPGNPYQTIGKGIIEVNAGGTVHLANGTYNQPNDRGLTINKDVTIVGESQAGTIIDAQGADRIFIIQPGNTVTIQDLTLTNGHVTGDGGAIWNDGTLTVEDCTLNNNTAYWGGAIFNDGKLNITNSTLNNNTAYNGGAIFNGGNLNITNSTLNNNTATNFGGAIYSQETLNITNSTLNNNTADFGGAIYNKGTLNVTGSNFESNTAHDQGGAIRNFGGDATNRNVHFSRIVGNTAILGSAIYSAIGTVNAQNNWWGSNAGPAGQVAGNVVYDPWIVLTIAADPTAIDNGGTSQVKADLLHDNHGAYHDPALGHVPDGLQIELTVPWGSFTDPAITHSIIKDTVNGSVTATFYANEGSIPSPNPVPVRATADGYTTNDAESAYIQIGQGANLSITKTDSPDPVIAGDPLTYTITITNNGPASAEGVTLDDVITGAGAFKAGTLQYRFKVNDGPWSAWTSFTSPLHLDLGTIDAGKTAVIEITGIVDPSTPKDTVITNTATADTTTTPGPKVATSTTTVDTQATINVVKTGLPEVTAGETYTGLYTVVVTNNGPSDAQNVVAGDPLPFNVLNGSWTLTDALGTVIATGTFSGNIFTVPIGTMAPGFDNRRIITVSGTVAPDTPAGTVSSTADVHTSTGPTYDFKSDPFITIVHARSAPIVININIGNNTSILSPHQSQHQGPVQTQTQTSINTNNNNLTNVNTNNILNINTFDPSISLNNSNNIGNVSVSSANINIQKQAVKLPVVKKAVKKHKKAIKRKIYRKNRR